MYILPQLKAARADAGAKHQTIRCTRVLRFAVDQDHELVVPVQANVSWYETRRKLERIICGERLPVVCTADYNKSRVVCGAGEAIRMRVGGTSTLSEFHTVGCLEALSLHMGRDPRFLHQVLALCKKDTTTVPFEYGDRNFLPASAVWTQQNVPVDRSASTKLHTHQYRNALESAASLALACLPR